MKFCNLSKENYDKTNKHNLFTYDEILLIETIGLKMTGNYFLASKKYKEQDKQTRGPLKAMFRNYIFGLIICPLITDRKKIADHFEKVQELANFFKKESNFHREN